MDFGAARVGRRREYFLAESAAEPRIMAALRDAAGVRIGLPATKWMLEIGAVFMRTETELILKSRRVVPGRLLKSGFSFEFPEWRAAAKDLCHFSAKRINQ